MVLAQVGMGGAAEAAVLGAGYGCVAMILGVLSLAGLAFGLLAFVSSCAPRPAPRLDERLAAGAVICLVVSIAVCVALGQAPGNSPLFLVVFAGPIIGVLSAWRSRRRRSRMDRRPQAGPGGPADRSHG